MKDFDLRKYLAENKLLKEETVDEIFGVAGRPRDRYLQRKKVLSNQKNDKVTNYHDLLRYYQYAIAKVPRHKREKATNAQAMHNRYGQEIWDVLKASYSDRELSDTPSPKFIDAANELIIAFRGESGNYRDKIHQPFYDMYQGDESESIDENKLLNESLEFTPEERKKLIYILGVELNQMKDQGDEFFAEEIEIVTSILNKIK